MKNKYDLRGVSAGKEDVHEAIQQLDKGLYPNAFCKILPDIVGSSDRYCNIMHADTAGTKTSLAYLYWKETGDLSVWEGIVQDALVMNLDDMACVGCVDDIILSSTIGRNKHLIPGAVVRALIHASSRFAKRMEEHGIRLHLSGGETADVGDIVRTVDVGFTTFARMKRSDLVINDIKDGDIIVGLASFGQATYEDEYNGGMGSNGLTGARHDVLSQHYAAKYPESFDPNTPSAVVYTGDRRLTDPIRLPDGRETTVGKLLLSPTRTYLPVLKKILEEFSGKRRSALHGIIHCTGGGQTKVLHFIQDKRVVKDNLFPPPPLFSLIRESSRTQWQEMYQVFNMGHRLEVYLPEEEAQAIIAIARFFNIEARIIGRVENASGRSVVIHGPDGILEYA
ncbi:MAG: hypothetical protein RLY31_1150 [Bacteroidota bacterium]|jgi:phosphoribosylformylglycinamidine cyclo-ligase